MSIRHGSRWPATARRQPAAAVALRARDQSHPALVFQLVIYPAIDNSPTCNDWPSKTDNATGYFLTTLQMDWYRKQYVRTTADGDEPYCSPIWRPRSPVCRRRASSPPRWNPARRGRAVRQLLEAAGVPVTLYRAEGMFHGFFNMDLVLEGAKQAQGVAFGAIAPPWTSSSRGDDRSRREARLRDAAPGAGEVEDLRRGLGSRRGADELRQIVQKADEAGFLYVAVCDHLAVTKPLDAHMQTTWYDTVATLGWSRR